MTSESIYPEYPCITEAAIARFKPTWLMAKRHRVTGLMYFCKTTGKDPIKYLGSGIRWMRHLTKHGRDVETIWHQRFDDIYLLVEFALGFSEDADIVASREWANLRPEDGLGGGQTAAISKATWHNPSPKLVAAGLRNLRYATEMATKPGVAEKRKATYAKIGHQRGSKNSHFGTVWVTNGSKPLVIPKDELAQYLMNGYHRGRKWSG